jgi:hypothetical protein
MDTDSTKTRMSRFLLTSSFARANAASEPITSEIKVVLHATIRLLAIILKKGWARKMET